MGKCTCQDKKTVGLCVACTVEQMSRNNYFDGKYLDARSFEVEQAYNVGKERRHNRFLHGTGVTCGLRVKEHPNSACRNRFVLVEPGIASDCCGREIYVGYEETVDFRSLFLDAWEAINGHNAEPDDEAHTIQLCIEYTECPTEEVPALFNDCGCDDTALQPNQILEGYRFGVRIDPEETATDPNGVELTWAGTLNFARAGLVALDETAERLYIVTVEDPADLYVVNTGNDNTIDSHPLPAAARGLALSADGSRLYVSLADTDNTVQVLDTADFSLVNSLLHSAPPTKLVVSESDDNLHVLLPSISIVANWSDAINTSGADLVAARLDDVSVGADPADMVVYEDDDQLIVANAGDDTLSLIDLTNLGAGATSQAVDVTPAMLAAVTTVNGARLYMADSATPQVRAFNLDTLAGAGIVQPLVDTPLAMAASPTGRWLYLLAESGGASELQVIETQALEMDSLVIGGDVPVGDSPRQILINGDNNLIYIPFAGDPAVDATGGVALVELRESECDVLFEATLDGCPACDEDENCLVLATVTGYVFDSDVGDDELDNLRDRPLLPSTQVIYEVVRCLINRGLAGSEPGEPGPQGDPGQGITAVNVDFVDCTEPGSVSYDATTGVLDLEIPRGCDGADGTDGQDGEDGTDGQSVDEVIVNFVSCDEPASSTYEDGVLTLTIPSGCDDKDMLGHICAISWNHGAIPIGEPVPIATPFDQIFTSLGPALVVAFDRPVRNGDIGRHTFRVEVESRQGEQLPTSCWCDLINFEAEQNPVGIRLPEDCKLSVEVLKILDPGMLAVDPEEPVTGAIFLLPPQIDTYQDDLRVTIEGDHMRTMSDDGEWGEALDANFLLGELPTGDGVAGGRFFSWLRIREERFPGGFFNAIVVLAADGGRVDINRASARELTTIRGVGPEIADAIVALRRDRNGFGSVEELREVSGIGPTLVARLINEQPDRD